MKHYDHPKYQAVRHLLLHLWDKATGAGSYDKHEWEELARGIDELSRGNLGPSLLETGLGTEELTPIKQRMVVVMGSKDGNLFTEVGRFVLDAPLLPVMNLREHKFIKFAIDTE